MRRLPLILVPLCAALVTLFQDEPVDLVGEAPKALLRFRITDPTDIPIPGRLTFLGSGGPGAELFPVVDGAPDELAVRKNVVYSLSGVGAITVPPGRYTVYASRGLEWSLDSVELEFVPGKELTWAARLEHEVNTDGWVSGDYHLHTLTYSGHGDANLKERVISLIGEGVDFAVATDHNHNTDYDPTIAELGARDAIHAVVGNEVSTSIGHFNAFPLDAERPIPDHGLTDANELFRLIREEPNDLGIVPVIQLNHPRWDGIDYFAQTGLDPVTAESDDPTYSPDFDSLEVLNENVGWGYHDPIADSVETSGNRHSVLEDWFGLLNRGHRYAAVGNSDSHTVHYAFAGYPRNYTPSSTDVAGEIDPTEVAAAIRAKRVFTTLGPFVEVSANGVPMGGDVTAKNGHVELELRVQAASWIDCDRVKIVLNGTVQATLEVPDTRRPERLQASTTLCLLADCDEHDPRGPRIGPYPDVRDGWVVVIVEGDDSLAPVVYDRARPARPFAVSNPIWIDGDGDGVWTSPWERAAAVVARLVEADNGPFNPGPSWGFAVWPGEQALALDAVQTGGLATRWNVSQALGDADRNTRLSAARAAERFAHPRLVSPLGRAWQRNEEDPYFAVALLRALRTCGEESVFPYLTEFVQRFGTDALRRYADELDALLEGRQVTSWLVLGNFDAPAAGDVQKRDHGPEFEVETDGSYTDSYMGRSGAEIRWRELDADDTGYLDLNAIASAGAASENVLAYAQTWLYSDDAREVFYAVGTDDGSRVYLGQELIYDNPARRGANPLEHLGELSLRPGWNRLLVKVENGTGGFGLYCRVFDDTVRVARRPE